MLDLFVYKKLSYWGCGLSSHDGEAKHFIRLDLGTASVRKYHNYSKQHILRGTNRGGGQQGSRPDYTTMQLER